MNNDPFQLLGLPARPLLLKEEIGNAYRQLAARCHPDKNEGDASHFSALGEALQIVSDPSHRLWILAGGKKRLQPPWKATELFPQIASLLQEADHLLGKQSSSKNILLQALLLEPCKKLITRLQSLLQHVEQWSLSLDEQLIMIDSHWPEHDAQEMILLADSYAYANRWKIQLRERQLSLECFLL